MILKTSFTKLFWRAACTLLAALVTTFVALFPPPASAQGHECALSDVAAWQTQLSDPQEELTPRRIFEVTSAFVMQCPDRPEILEANRIAAMAAVDMGKADIAVSHFERAGYLRDDMSRFYYASALLAFGEGEMAWELRDQMVADWETKLTRRGDVDLAARTVPGGMIYTVRFDRVDSETGIGAAWLAVPDGAGWPATLSLGSSRQMTAFHRLRVGAEAPALRHVDLYRCRSRRMLAKADKDIPIAELDEAASVTLTAYLSLPDVLITNNDSAALATCLWPNRLFPRPAR